ncbi:MAG: PAS domain S-box protein [Pedobacter sp.]|nr:MAG: PAS domain S-box protein [Pedobacter sp.]
MVNRFDGKGYQAIFNYSQSAMLIVSPDSSYTMLDVNEAYLQSTNSTREELVGKSVFEVFPANPTDQVSKNIERTYYSFQQAVSTKKPHTMSNYRYDIPIRGTNDFEERYWTTTNTPVLDENGEVLYFIHSPINVTEVYKLQERERQGLDALNNQRKQLYAFFMQAPVGIAIFRGPDYIVDLINQPLCDIYGKTVDEMLGRSVFEVLTHAKGIGYEQLLDGVRLTGVPFKAQASAAPLMRNGKLETAYLNFVYEPFYEDDGLISGVITVVTEVTEEVVAKQLVEEAEERARLAIDAVDLGIFDVNLLNGETTTSTLFANIFGFKKPASREDYVKAFHKDDLALRKKAHEEALVTGVLFFEARVIWPNGSVHWARVEGKVIYNRDNTPVRILGTLLDITEQRKSLEEQQKLITLVANSVDLMSILDLDGTNSYINEAGRQMLGLMSDEEVASTPISQLHAPEDYDLVQNEVLPTVMREGKWAGRMMVQHAKTGEVFPVYNNCIRIDDPITGETLGIGAVMRDQRPELAAKQALAESELLLRNITIAAPTGLWMSDDKGAITYLNQTWLDWVGTSYDSQLGYGWLNSILDQDRDKVAQKFLRASLHQQIFEVEFRIVHVDGTIHWCVATGKPQYDERNSFTGYIGACVDITEQKHLQQQKDDFIGIASHELKTPVTSIKAYTQILERMLLKKGDTKEAAMIAKMDAQINRLTSLIADLLDVTKINSGKLQFNDRDFDFNELVREVVEELQRTTEQHELIERLEGVGLVYSDKERIGQVITNLISNAIKYSPTASQIIVYTHVEENEVILCVEDFGVGIPDDKIDMVFEQFYRVSGDMQHTFPGLGLGLYISAEIIKREQGRIWVTSDAGKGSKFFFALPMRKSRK